MTSDLANLPSSVADLLDASLGKNDLPGILADWLEERSTYWLPLALALRMCEPPVASHGFWIDFRYRPVTPEVFFWIVSTNHTSKWHGAPADGDVVIGAYRRTPEREGRWARLIPRSKVSAELRSQLWGLFLETPSVPASWAS